MDRRVFLQRGLAGGAVLAVGAVGLGRWRGTVRFAPVKPLLVLDAFAFGVVASAAEALLPMENVDFVDVAHGVDSALQYVSVEAQSDVAQLTDALNSPLLGLMDLRPTPFVEMDVARRRSALDAWRRSVMDLRKSGYHALRRLCTGAYYANSATWAAVGYPGPPNLRLAP